MKGAIRVVLVDPTDESRRALETMLAGLGSVWLAHTSTSYQDAVKSVAEHGPDLTIVSLDADPERAIELVQSLHRAHAGAVVLPASKLRDGEFILRVMRAGAREFLPLPSKVEELLAAIERLFQAGSDEGSAGPRNSRVTVVTGASGGVGCTTLAVNLATTLAKDDDRSVVLADFDLLLGSVDACLDIVPDHTVLDVAQNVDRLDLTLLKRSLTRHSSGLYVLPRPNSMEDVARIDPESLRRVISMLKAAFSTVVIDASKGLQASDLVAFEMADTILLVVQLELTCLRNSGRLMQLFRRFDGLADRIQVVVNRAGSRECEISAKKAEETLKLPMTWEVPNSSREFVAARLRGVPLEAVAAGSRPHKAIQEIARAISPPAASNSEKEKSRIGRLAAMFF